MQKIIIQSTPPNTVALSTIGETTAENKLFGYKSRSGEAGIICQNDYEEGNFVIRCESQFTKGNRFLIGQAPTLQECIKDAVERGGEVYMFDNFRELGQFLVDNGKKS